MKFFQRGIPLSIWGIGIAQFLMNVSSVIVFGLSAVYMKNVLGVSTSWIGFLEGFVEAFAHFLKLFSGMFSDYIGKRKTLFVIGYLFCALSRPITAVATSALGVFTSRLLGRIGNGIQATPRDALVADLSPPDKKGTCYGLRNTLGMAGSFFGGLIGLCVMYFTAQSYQTAFWVSTFFALAAVLFLILMVKEKKTTPFQDTRHNYVIRWNDIPRLGKRYWYLMSVVVVFMFAKVNESFLLLHGTEHFKLESTYTPVILMLYSIGAAFSAYPMGKLSDRLERHNILLSGLSILVLSNIIIAFSNNLWTFFIGVFLWGVELGINQSIMMTLISDHVPHDLRGTGFGFYHLISAIGLLLGGTCDGLIMEHIGSSMLFFVSASIGAVTVIMASFIKNK